LETFVIGSICFKRAGQQHEKSTLLQNKISAPNFFLTTNQTVAHSGFAVEMVDEARFPGGHFAKQHDS